MKKKWVLFTILGLVILFSVGSLKGNYNQIVSLHENVETSWAQVENVLQRRNDLIPNLVNTVRGYAAQEERVLTEVTEARSRVGGAQTIPDKINANNQLSSAVSRLLLVAEQYPDLKSNQNFLALQDELAGTENRIAVERKRYNEAVQGYNTTVRRFPANIIAGAFGYERQNRYFETSEGAKEVPEVNFNTSGGGE